MINFLRYSIIILSATLFSGCFGGACDVIPNVTFRSPENLSLSSHPELFAPKGWVYTSGGVCGLIVHNTGDGFIAYDRCSTVDADKKNRVRVEGLQIVDDQSGAKWLLMDGTPTHVAECSLKRYNVRKGGNLYYYVEN